MQCEMCGRDSVLVEAIIEGSLLSVCRNCASFGNVVRLPTKGEVIKTRIDDKDDEELIVEDYNLRVKKARESKKLTQEDLAKYVAEKESVIHRVESGQFEPTLELAKKLEQFLRIKLIKNYKREEKKENKNINLKNSSLTIGDVLKIKDEE